MQIEEKDFIKFLTVNQAIIGNTIRTYTNRFQIIKRWLEENKKELTRESVTDFLYEQKYTLQRTNSTVNTYRNVFVQIDRFCKYHNLPHGFTEETKNLPKTRPEITILSEEEIELLLSTRLEYQNRNGVDCSDLDEKNLTLTSFLAITGCRFDEAASLKIKRLDIENGKAFLVQTKNKDNRYVYFDGEHLKHSLKKLIEGRSPEDLVFVSSTGSKILPGTYNDDLRRRAERAGIMKRVHAHLLRHTFATHLLRAGVDITIVSTLLGHKDIRVTYETYIHLADTTLQSATKKHPLLRKYVTASEIIDEFKKQVDTFSFEKDKRFNFQILQSSNGIELKLLLT